MSRNAIKDLIKSKIIALNGKPFQQMCWDLLTQVYPDLHTPKKMHDWGSDGHTFDASIFFACYAPETIKYVNKDTIEKIDEDYEKFTNKWKSKNQFKTWVFLTKDNLMGPPQKKIAELNQIKDDIKKESWGLDQLVNKAMGLSQNKIEEIFNLPQSSTSNTFMVKGDVNYYAQAEKEKLKNNFLNELFDYAINKLSSLPASDPKQDEIIFPQDKIILNFDDEKEREEVSEYFKQAYTVIELIEKRISMLDTMEQQRLKTFIQQKYKALKRKGLSNMAILDELFNVFTPEKQISNPDFAEVVRALVLIYFEDCTIFEKK